MADNATLREFPQSCGMRAQFLALHISGKYFREADNIRMKLILVWTEEQTRFFAYTMQRCDHALLIIPVRLSTARNRLTTGASSILPL